MQNSLGWRRKLIFTIATVLVAFVGFTVNTSLQATLCDSNQYTVQDTEDDCIDSCKNNGGEAACNAKFGYLPNGSPCTNFGASYVHWESPNDNGTCECIMDCQVGACRECDEQCDDSDAECP